MKKLTAQHEPSRLCTTAPPEFVSKLDARNLPPDPEAGSCGEFDSDVRRSERLLAPAGGDMAVSGSH